MKHLKSFKLFESEDFLPMEGTEIWHDLNDMLLELEDIGYGAEVTDMSNKDEYVIGIQICKRRGGYLTDYGGFNIGGDLKESLFRVKEFMSDWKMLINSNHGWVYLTDDGRVLTSGHTVTPNYPKFTKLDIIFSKKIDVNEGFFTKVRDKINKLIKPEEPNRISKKEYQKIISKQKNLNH